MTRPALRATIALAGVLVAGCGTTVPLQTQEYVYGDHGSAVGGSDGLGGTSNDGGGVVITPTDDATSLPTDLPTSGSGDTQGIGGGSGSGHGSASGATSTPGTHSTGSRGADTSYGAIPKTGRGWDGKNVYIGVTTVNDIGTVATAIGLKSANPGNQVKDGKAMVAELNSQGGLFGRKVVLAAQDFSTASMLVNPQQDGAQACTHFTQDRPVIAVWNTLTPLDLPTVRSCFAQAHVPFLSGSIAPTDTGALNQLHGYAISVISPSFGRPSK